ncbi:hypothetical protein JCM8547_008333 [Rhodosporidiobolus lusitaniae]
MSTSDESTSDPAHHRARTSWTADEDQRLIEGVACYGGVMGKGSTDRWGKIYGMLEGEERQKQKKMLFYLRSTSN